MFYVGQKVVCVDAGPNPMSGLVPPLTKDAVYTISDVKVCWDGCGVNVVEAPAPFDVFGPHVPLYMALRFRPAAERKTDISVFEKLLTPAPIKEPSNV